MKAENKTELAKTGTEICLRPGQSSRQSMFVSDADSTSRFVAIECRAEKRFPKNPGWQHNS